MSNFYIELAKLILPPLSVGVVLWMIGNRSSERKLKADAIRDLMTLRGDNSSPDFRRALNKVSITFHDDADIRQDIRTFIRINKQPDHNCKNIRSSYCGIDIQTMSEERF